MTMFSTRTWKNRVWELLCELQLLGHNPVTISLMGRFRPSTETKSGPISLQSECERWGMSAETRKVTKFKDKCYVVPATNECAQGY